MWLDRDLQSLWCLLYLKTHKRNTIPIAYFAAFPGHRGKMKYLLAVGHLQTCTLHTHLRSSGGTHLSHCLCVPHPRVWFLSAKLVLTESCPRCVGHTNSHTHIVRNNHLGMLGNLLHCQNLRTGDTKRLPELSPACSARAAPQPFGCDGPRGHTARLCVCPRPPPGHSNSHTIVPKAFLGKRLQSCTSAKVHTICTLSDKEMPFRNAERVDCFELLGRSFVSWRIPRDIYMKILYCTRFLS